MDVIPLSALVFVLVTAVALTLLLYWLKICPVLYRNGARFPTGLKLWQFFDDLNWYQQMRGSQNTSPTLYYTLVILFWFSVAMAVVVALRLLWSSTHSILLP